VDFATGLLGITNLTMNKSRVRLVKLRTRERFYTVSGATWNQSYLDGRLTHELKIGNPIKDRVKLSERHGLFVVTCDTMEIVTPSRRATRRLGVRLRKVMDEPIASLSV
jgi:hypothetical protein